jgi:parallel beta-helix repeat protein
MKRLIFALTLLLCLLAGAILADTRYVTQPIQITSDSHYERGQAIVYDGTDYWLFYGRSASVTGNYQNSNPDTQDYEIYYKKASTIPGLETATPVAIGGAVNSYLGELGAAVFGGKVWVFASIDPNPGASGDKCQLYGWYTSDGGSSWNQTEDLVAAATPFGDGQAHHDEIAFDGKLWLVTGSGKFYTRRASSSPELEASWTAPLSVDAALTGGLARFFIEGTYLYLVIFSNNISYIYNYNAPTNSWIMVDNASTPRAYDPVLFKVGPDYVLANAPMPTDWSHQWLEYRTGSSLTGILSGTPSKMLSATSYGGNTWGEMWPKGITDNGGTSYVFFTSERDQPAQEGTGNIWYVEIDWPLGYDHYHFVQTAVEASVGGDDIIIGEGIYTEQVHITTDNLTLTGADIDDVVIKSPAAMSASFVTGTYNNYPVVFVDDASAVISTLTIDGDHQGDGNYRFVGLGIWNADCGADNIRILSVMNSTFSGAQHGIGIYSYNNTGGPYTITLSDILVDDFQKTAVALNGPGYTVDLDRITTIGEGPTTVTAQNGIQIGGGVTGTVDDCNISLVDYTGASWTASGFLVFGSAVANGVTIDQCQTSLYVQDGNCVFNGGQVTNPTGEAAIAYSTSAKGATSSFKNFLAASPMAPEDLPAGDKAAVAVTLHNSEFYGTGAPDSYGVYAYAVGPVSFEVTNCLFTDWTYAVSTWEVGGTVTAGIHDNDFTGNAYGFATNAAATQDVSYNWFGSTDAAVVSAMLDGNVDYTPWLSSGVDGEPGSPGFQPSRSLVYVDDDSQQSGTDGRINEAINDPNVFEVFIQEGTYNESILIGSGFSKNGLVISGNPFLRPVITGGVRLTQTAAIDGLTFKNLVISGLAPSGDGIFDMDNGGAIDNFVMDKCVIDGENVADRNGFLGQNLTGTLAMTGNTFVNILGWAVMDIESGSGDGGSNLPFATVTFANNSVTDCNGSVSLRGKAAPNRTNLVNAYGNAFSNIGGNASSQGQHWAALEINHAEAANIYNNNVDDVSEGEWGEGQAFQLWDIGTLDMHDNTITNNFQGIFIYGGGAAPYGGPYAIPGGSIYHNTISGNTQYGISVASTATGGPLMAESNYWGALLCQDIVPMVDGNVDYDPWCNSDYSACTFTCTVAEVWVDDDWVGATEGQDLGGGIYFGYNGFATIDDAIAAVAVSGTVHILAGTYTEQVHVNKAGLNIIGAGLTDVTIVSPATLTSSFPTGSYNNFPVVFVDGVNATISGVTIDGNHMGDANYRFVGVGFWNGGGTFSDAKVINVMNSTFSGAQHGVGLYTYNNTGGPYTLVVENVVVDDFQKTAVAIGGAGMTADLDNVTTIGEGPTTVTAQNGIQISAGVTATVDDCHISLVDYTGASWTASGFLVFGNAVANGVNIDRCQTSLYVQDGNCQFNGGTITNPTLDAGIAYSTGAKSGGVTRQPLPVQAFDAELVERGDKSPVNVAISHSTITGTGAIDSYGVYAYASGPVMFTVTNCIFSGWTVAVSAWEAGGTVTAGVHENKFTGNDYALATNAVAVQNGSNNYFGTVDAAAVTAMVEGNFDFTPYLSSGTEVPPGFVADYGVMYAEAGSAQTGSTGRINEAVANTNDYGTVYINEGTYAENVVVGKPVTVIGLSSAKGVAEINPGGGTGVDITSSDVIVQNLTIHGVSAGIQAYLTPAEYAASFGYQNLQILDNTIYDVSNGAWGFAISMGTESERYNPADPLGIYDPSLTDLLDFSGLMISGNEIYSTTGAAVLLQSMRPHAGGYLEFTGNNIHNTSMSALWVDAVWALHITDNDMIDNGNGVFLSNYGDGYYEGNENNAFDPKIIVGSGNTITGNSGRGIALYDGFPGLIDFNNNTIYGNGTNYFNYLTTAADARNNYWGALLCQDIQAGISGNVDFEPWCNSDFSYCGFSCTLTEVWVDDDYCETCANDGHFWGFDAFATIQDGIDAVAGGGTVHVLAGSYAEQVIIAKNVTVSGATGATIVPPTGGLYAYTIPESGATFYPMLFAYGGTDNGSGYVSGTATIEAKIMGMVFDGNNSGTVSRFVGTLMRNCLGQSKVSGNEYRELLFASGNPETFGIMVYGNSGVEVSGNTVNDWTRGGIGIMGDNGGLPDPTAQVIGNTVIGEGPLPQGHWAQNGIQLGYGATGTLDGNEVSDIKYIPDTWAASAINVYAPGSGTVIRGNYVHDCEAMLYLTYGMNTSVQNNNIFENNEFMMILSGNGITVSGNQFNSNDMAVYVADAANVTVTGNDFTGNEYAFLCDGAASIIHVTGNNFIGSTGVGVYVDDYENIEPGDVHINFNNFTGNTLAIQNLITGLLDAQGNWWGNITGPSIVAKNGGSNEVVNRPAASSAIDGNETPYAGTRVMTASNSQESDNMPVTGEPGTGDAITTNVDYSPWWGANYVGSSHSSSWNWYLNNSNNSQFQDAVDLAGDGDVIYVSAELYTQPVNIENRSGLAFHGQGRSNTFFKPAGTLGWNVASYGTTRRTAIRVVNSTNITFEGMNFNYNDIKANNTFGFLYWNSSGELSNSDLLNMNVPDVSGGYYEMMVYARAVTPEYGVGNRAQLNVYNNEFVNSGRIAVVTHDWVHVNLIGNTFRKTESDFGYALEIGSASTGNITSNVFHGFNTWALSDKSNSAAIYIENSFTTGLGPLTKTVTVEQNEIYNCQYGLYIGNSFAGYTGNVDLVANVIGNSIHNNATTGSETSGGFVIVDEGANAGSSVTVNMSGNQFVNNDDYGGLIYTNGNGAITVSMTDNFFVGNIKGLSVKDYGAPSTSTYNLTIYHNIFQNNLNAEDDAAGGYWDDGVSEGNCWSDFTGNLGDPYPIIGTAGAVDRYPNVNCGSACDCRPGDADGDPQHAFNLLDILYLIANIYQDGPDPVPYELCSGDANCDCQLNLLDILTLIENIYNQGPALCGCGQWIANCQLPIRDAAEGPVGPANPVVMESSTQMQTQTTRVTAQACQ